MGKGIRLVQKLRNWTGPNSESADSAIPPALLVIFVFTKVENIMGKE